MNILLVGGQGALIDGLITKMKKEGHRVYLLTGTRHGNSDYVKVFERYDFTYDTLCLNDIFNSTTPDVTIYMGAYDTNYKWINEQVDASRYTSCLMNILMGHSARGKGKFIYISSEDVYRGHFDESLDENAQLCPVGQKSIALAQAEQMCESFCKTRGTDIVTLRLDHLYGIPKSREDVSSIVSYMCLEALSTKTISLMSNDEIGPLYVNDAVEYVYRVAVAKEHNSNLYNISGNEILSSAAIADMVNKYFKNGITIKKDKNYSNVAEKIHLSNKLYDNEFGCNYFNKVSDTVTKIAEKMEKNPSLYLEGSEFGKSREEKLVDKIGWLWTALFPFLESIIAVILVTYISNTNFALQYFNKVDFYLLYVVIFAVIYGQQQAAFAGLFATIAFTYMRLQTLTAGELLLDSNTYVWFAQLFIMGLGIGHMKDIIKKLKNEADDEKDFISQQLTDIQDINSSNVRVKDALETQILNQSDSVGKIYSITSALDQYSRDEVLFYAAEMIGKLMNSKDVAIYTVSNEEYARLFAATSADARVMGNTLKYTTTEAVYESLMQKKVFINRQMDKKWPMMASGVYDGDNIQAIIMVWGLPWESMTLGQANQLTVIGSLIQNSVIRANKYLEVLANERFAADSRMMETEAFTSLVSAYLNAQGRGLTQCAMIEIHAKKNSNMPEDNVSMARVISEKLRESDYTGTLKNGNLYVLLSNTSDEGAEIIMRRFGEMGFDCSLIKGEAITNLQ